MEETDKLAANCPRCFGPPTGVTNNDEPDIILALDGNFSHKRIEAGSVPITGWNPETPELFIDEEQVKKMAEILAHPKVQGTQEKLVVRHLLDSFIFSM